MSKAVCSCCGYVAKLAAVTPELCEICLHTHIGNIPDGAQIDLNQLAMAIAWIGNDVLDAINSQKYREP